MISRSLIRLVTSLFTLAILTACATSTPLAPTSTPQPPSETPLPPTSTPIPTGTSTATATQIPPTLTPTLEPTYTPTPVDTETPTATATFTPGVQAIYIPLPAASSNTVNIYMIQIGGGSVACGDRLIAVGSGVEISGDYETDIKAGLQKLFSLKSQYYGDLYNPLYASRLRVQKVNYKGSLNELEVFLSGTYKPSGDPCDNERVRAQVWSTMRQFRGIDSLTVMLNRVPFGDRLSNDK